MFQLDRLFLLLSFWKFRGSLTRFLFYSLTIVGCEGNLKRILDPVILLWARHGPHRVSFELVQLMEVLAGEGEVAALNATVVRVFLLNVNLKVLGLNKALVASCTLEYIVRGQFGFILFY